MARGPLARLPLAPDGPTKAGDWTVAPPEVDLFMGDDYLLDRRERTMKMKELKKQIKSFFDEYSELRAKCEKLMRGTTDD